MGNNSSKDPDYWLLKSQGSIPRRNYMSPEELDEARKNPYTLLTSKELAEIDALSLNDTTNNHHPLLKRQSRPGLDLNTVERANLSIDNGYYSPVQKISKTPRDLMQQMGFLLITVIITAIFTAILFEYQPDKLFITFSNIIIFVLAIYIASKTFEPVFRDNKQKQYILASMIAILYMLIGIVANKAIYHVSDPDAYTVAPVILAVAMIINAISIKYYK